MEFCHRQGVYIDVLVVDCTAEILNYLRPFAEDEEVFYGFNEESPFSFPAIDALLPLIRRWAAQSTDERTGFYTPEEEEDAEVDGSPRPKAPARRRRSALRGATPTGGGAKAKAKRPTVATLAQDMGSMLEALPKISAELGLMWGWPVEAFLFGLAWAGIFRRGPCCTTRRPDFTKRRSSRSTFCPAP